MLQVMGREPYLVMFHFAFLCLNDDQKMISKHCTILHSSLDTIESCGGGSARCMMAEVFYHIKMMIEKNILKNQVILAVDKLYSVRISNIQFQKTRSEFDGDITLVVFPLLSASKKSPEHTGKEIGNYLIENVNYIDSFNVVKGFFKYFYNKSF